MGLIFVVKIFHSGNGAQFFKILILESGDHDIPGIMLVLRIGNIRKIGLAAQNDAVCTELRVPVAPALADNAEPAVHGRGIAQASGGRLHLGKLDHGAQTGGFAPVDGRQDSEGDLGSGIPVNAPVGMFGAVAAHKVMHTGDRSQPGVGLSQNIVGSAEDFGPVAETAAPHIDEPGVQLLKVQITLFPLIKGSGTIALGQSVGHFYQAVKGLVHLVQVIIHGNVELAGVGAQVAQAGTGHGPGIVQRIEIGLVERSTVPHGVTHPRHFYLDHLSPQLSQVRDGMGCEDIHGGAQPADALQGLGFFMFVARIKSSPAKFFIGHLHFFELFLALGAWQIFYSCFSQIFCHYITPLLLSSLTCVWPRPSHCRYFNLLSFPKGLPIHLTRCGVLYAKAFGDVA